MLVHICDGLLTTDPSEEAARTDTAASNPEGEGATSNALRLPGPKGQRQTFHASRGVQESRAQAEGGRRAEGAGVTGGDDRGIVQHQENNQEPSGLEKLLDSGLGGSTALPVAREAPRELSSHASGEAWPFQVRPTCW
ncbi:hypothetical protein NDU88_003534 [Pleurodeles waltl]|uniref:Uncharacterized protein n=1 Tax=Pleurodeles waltl TaxID=8319 RepID=A0AAV7L686_PLEWA|nr:hypothetical protein NDU88_003534 [Pleurodeles waltl]